MSDSPRSSVPVPSLSSPQSLVSLPSSGSPRSLVSLPNSEVPDSSVSLPSSGFENAWISIVADGDESVSLPSMVDRLEDMVMDTAGDEDIVEQDMLDLAHGKEASLRIPAYMDGTIRDDVVEIYCAPKICLVALKRGLRAGLSVDVKVGHDLNKKSVQEWMWTQLSARRPRCIVCCPPCKKFSVMQNLNIGKMDVVQWDNAMAEAEHHVDLSMDVMAHQSKNGDLAIFEHPARASSWNRDTVSEKYVNGPFVRTLFPQCAFGLVSPLGFPMEKKTYFMHNIDEIATRFGQARCSCTPQLIGGTLKKHRTIEGSEQGRRVSEYAEGYPDLLVEAMVDCIQTALARTA